MTPFYLHRAGKQLFGVHHGPPKRSARADGVVLCYPMGQEYLLVHRAFRQLAIRLARAGFDVLRFDYSGTGDSAGESDEGELGRWMEDIALAADDLRAQGRLERVGLVGLRLGATLAALVGAQRGDVGPLVLWDPVVNGRESLRALRASHREWLLGALPRRQRVDGDARELLGFPLTERLRRGVEGIDLLALERRPASRVLIVESAGTADGKRLKDSLDALGGRVDYQQSLEQRVWMREEGADRMLVPNRTLQGIVSWLSEVGA